MALLIPKISPAIFFVAISTLQTTAISDIVFIIFAADVVHCFHRAYQISQNFLSNLQFGKLTHIYLFWVFSSWFLIRFFKVNTPTLFCKTDGVYCHVCKVWNNVSWVGFRRMRWLFSTRRSPPVVERVTSL